ncbi:hypothetical protein [Paraburkholderia strydomiana]|jgi:hypothetical protein|uniref:hypothetical protein n=1 Tax=Paraburkholderia strydomiana TaxID=1245417 RepID=UPI0038B85669
MIGVDESGGANSAGVAIGCAPTIGCHDVGPVRMTVPLCPSLMPPCESRMTGLRALSGVATAFDTAQTVVSKVAAATDRMD